MMSLPLMKPGSLSLHACVVAMTFGKPIGSARITCVASVVPPLPPMLTRP